MFKVSIIKTTEDGINEQEVFLCSSYKIQWKDDEPTVVKVYNPSNTMYAVSDVIIDGFKIEALLIHDEKGNSMDTVLHNIHPEALKIDYTEKQDLDARSRVGSIDELVGQLTEHMTDESKKEFMDQFLHLSALHYFIGHESTDESMKAAMDVIESAHHDNLVL